MNPISSILGVFAVLGTWPNWESYFDLSRRGQKVSFIVLALSLLPLWVVAYGVQSERALQTDTDIVLPGVMPFILIIGLWLFTFPGLAYLIGMIFEKMDRVRVWTITRNWAVFALSLLAGAAFALVNLGMLPFILANGVFLAAYLGVLAVDVRLAQKVAGFNWGTAILIGCVIVAVGLTFILLAISR
jgi:hypothetical protein